MATIHTTALEEDHPHPCKILNMAHAEVHRHRCSKILTTALEVAHLHQCSSHHHRCMTSSSQVQRSL